MSDRLRKQLDAFIKGTATDGKALCDIFYKASDGSKQLPEYWNIQVPKEVYDHYWDLHEASWRLVDALERVLEDPEHQLIMEEAQKLGYRLPALDVFRQELQDYREVLLDFDPYRVRNAKNGYVTVPIRMADMLHNLMKYNSFMVARVFDGCFNTDYMKHFGFYKNSGYPYEGATALQETMDVLVGMMKTSKEIDRQVERGRQKEHWPHMLPKRDL